MRTKMNKHGFFEGSYEELEKNIFRDIKSFWIEHFRDLSDREVENIENEKDTPFLDELVSFLIRECGYSDEDVYDEYGIREIKNLLSDFAVYGYDHVTPMTILDEHANSVNSMHKKLEQRIKRLERLIRVNESESDTISLFRAPYDIKRTLIKTFTVDEITPQRVIAAIKEDMENVSLYNINEYVSSNTFNRAYKKACDDMGFDPYAHDNCPHGSYEQELDAEDCMYSLCVGNDVNNCEDVYISVRLSVEVFSHSDDWEVDEDDTEVEIEYMEAFDHEDLLKDNSLAADKIREVVNGMIE